MSLLKTLQLIHLRTELKALESEIAGWRALAFLERGNPDNHAASILMEEGAAANIKLVTRKITELELELGELGEDEVKL